MYIFVYIYRERESERQRERERERDILSAPCRRPLIYVSCPPALLADFFWFGFQFGCPDLHFEGLGMLVVVPALYFRDLGRSLLVLYTLGVDHNTLEGAKRDSQCSTIIVLLKARVPDWRAIGFKNGIQ